MESNVVSGVAYSSDEAKITLVRMADQPGVAAAIFGPLADAHVNVDMIVQNISEDGRTDMTFTVARRFRPRRRKSKGRKTRSAITGCRRPDVAKVSVVGDRDAQSIRVCAQRMFSALAEEGVNIQVITTSEIKVSVLIQRRYMELAVRSLHAAFELEAT